MEGRSIREESINCAADEGSAGMVNGMYSCRPPLSRDGKRKRSKHKGGGELVGQGVLETKERVEQKWRSDEVYISSSRFTLHRLRRVQPPGSG